MSTAHFPEEWAVAYLHDMVIAFAIGTCRRTMLPSKRGASTLRIALRERSEDRTKWA